MIKKGVLLLTILFLISCTEQCPPEFPVMEGNGDGSICRTPTDQECENMLGCSPGYWDNDKISCLCKEPTACEAAGGRLFEMRECDGTVSQVCALNRDKCYLDQVQDGMCTGVFQPRILCTVY